MQLKSLKACAAYNGIDNWIKESMQWLVEYLTLTFWLNALKKYTFLTFFKL